MKHLKEYIVAIGIFLGAVAPALPDTSTYSPRSITFAIAMGLIGAGVYLGAPKPAAPP